jgi:hypothetical protein
MTTYQKQEVQSIDDRVYAQHWLPIFSKNVQTNIPIQVDVRVEHL